MYKHLGIANGKAIDDASKCSEYRHIADKYIALPGYHVSRLLLRGGKHDFLKSRRLFYAFRCACHHFNKFGRRYHARHDFHFRKYDAGHHALRRNQLLLSVNFCISRRSSQNGTDFYSIKIIFRYFARSSGIYISISLI